MEDRLLVLRCRRGGVEAMARIYRKYRKDLLVLAMALLNDKAAAEDVLHDVFLSFVQNLGGFRLTGSLKGYLLTCAANRSRNWNKAERRRGGLGPTASDADSATATGVAEGPLEVLACNEQLERLSAAMADLPMEQREVVMLHVQGALTFRAIATAQAIPTDTAKRRYRYGIERLRSLLNGEASR